MKTSNSNRVVRWFFLVLMGGLLGSLFLPVGSVDALQKKKGGFKDQSKMPEAPPAPKSSMLTHEEWQNAPLTALKPGEIDQLVTKEQQATKIKPAPLTTDEQFIRRVSLDLTGQLPLPADVKEFVADKSSKKRSKLIDRLLESDEFARNWAHYWRDVVASRLSDRRGLLLARPFEEWMFKQLKNNTSWGEITRAMLTAEGQIRVDEQDKNGAGFFLAGHLGPDAVNERAAETARVFLGMQIQCAQCHDHPFDKWKMVQFHELAGYFARVQERLVREENRPVGMELTSRPRGEHEMPGKDDPKKGFITHPRYLNGKSPGKDLSDIDRRKALADEIVNKNNYWFAGAFVNRLWGELMGQSFYQPVDDMGPEREAVFPAVLTRMTGSFRASNYDVKGLYRDIMNTETYQRQIRLGEATDQHLHFAAAYPTRLRADALWQSLVNVLGTFEGPREGGGRPMGPFAGPRGLEGMFKLEFGFDPSLKADEVEGSVPQALLMMNNPQINQKIKARGDNLLARILKSHPKDDDALATLYLRTLARKPTDKELEKCKSFIAKAKSRDDGFEDILWVLLNSTEFQTKR